MSFGTWWGVLWSTEMQWFSFPKDFDLVAPYDHLGRFA